ncbi:hypothetical protein LINPERPRIM_LOCUS41193 [Linum perenne]
MNFEEFHRRQEDWEETRTDSPLLKPPLTELRKVECIKNDKHSELKETKQKRKQ